MIHRRYNPHVHTEFVVNCFQITTLVDDSQAAILKGNAYASCELLSDYYFSR